MTRISSCISFLCNPFTHKKHRFVYQRVFVADGNFKADHVRLKNPDGDVWLSEGGSMTPKRKDYQEFLKTATERLTVSVHYNANAALTQPLLCRWTEGPL